MGLVIPYLLSIHAVCHCQMTDVERPTPTWPIQYVKRILLFVSLFVDLYCRIGLLL